MEEIFKGLLERAQYYEQFESFRNINYTGHFGDIQQMDLKVKVSIMSI